MHETRQEPDSVYRQADGLNWSRLKAMATSPRHYQHALTAQRTDTPALRLGRATHAAILEPDRFQVDWTVYDGRRAGKAWTAFQAQASGEILTRGEYDQAAAMARAVQADPALRSRLADGRAELSVYWSEAVPGLSEPLDMKARLDWLTRDENGWIVLDVKTARDIGRAFGTAAARYLYHGQLAHYVAGVSAALGGPVRAELLVVESQAPYDCGLLRLDDLALECGCRRRAELLERLAECMTTDDWPGQIPTPGWLELPEWELSRLDDLER